MSSPPAGSRNASLPEPEDFLSQPKTPAPDAPQTPAPCETPLKPETPSPEDSLDVEIGLLLAESSTASELDSPPVKRTRITEKTDPRSCSPQYTPLAPVGLDANEMETPPCPEKVPLCCFDGRQCLRGAGAPERDCRWGWVQGPRGGRNKTQISCGLPPLGPWTQPHRQSRSGAPAPRKH